MLRDYSVKPRPTISCSRSNTLQSPNVSCNHPTQVHRATACFPVDQPPEGKHWIHEVKHDGYRCQVLVENGQARVFTRNGFDCTDRYPSFVRAASKLRCKLAIIDGEAIVQNGDGASDFEALGSALRQRPHSIILYAFDLLHLDGKDLRQQTLMERRASLKACLE